MKLKYPRIAHPHNGTVIDLCPRVWIVWTTRTDDDLDYGSGDDDYPRIVSYRVVRIVCRGLTILLEWERR